MTSRQSLIRQPIRALKPLRSAQTSCRRQYSQAVQQPTNQPEVPSKNLSPVWKAAKKTAEDGHTTNAELDQAFEEVKRDIGLLFTHEGIPAEEDILSALQKCEVLASTLVHEPTSSSLGKKAASALLSLDDTGSRKDPPQKPPPSTNAMQNELSTLVFSVISYPPIFIAPSVLKSYVQVQATLGRPETLPGIFSLYANKPLPEEGSLPVQYADQSPDKVANAIPKAVADMALQTAIKAKQLVVAMDLIELSYAAKAFRRAKFVRNGLLPATAAVLAPIAVYKLASQLALLQTTMENGMATNVAFTGMLAYIGFTATIGVVAVTTANDQMDRVTWTPGLPLRERWIREDERAAIDKVAGAWGFRETWRRGEEEGEEWDALREWIGMKGMILDRTELMEGME